MNGLYNHLSSYWPNKLCIESHFDDVFGWRETEDAMSRCQAFILLMREASAVWQSAAHFLTETAV